MQQKSKALQKRPKAKNGGKRTEVHHIRRVRKPKMNFLFSVFSSGVSFVCIIVFTSGVHNCIPYIFRRFGKM